jgi:hypothetical protein
MGLDVADSRASVAGLKGRVVVFEEYDAPRLKTIDRVADMEGRRSACFTDSEGNFIEFTVVA